MSMKIQIPVAALADANVANCLARLMEALGNADLQGSKQWDVQAAQASVAVSAPATSVPDAPVKPAASVAVPAAVKPAASVISAPVAAKPAAAEPVAEKSAPVSAHRTQAVLEIADPDERYRLFLASLPSRSRLFLELVQKQGVVTIDEAMAALDMTMGKAMGGLTGSIARWAPDYGVRVPFEAIKSQGRRAWRWVGIGEDVEAQAKSEEAPAKTAPVTEEPAEKVAVAKTELSDNPVKTKPGLTEEERSFNSLISSLNSAEAKKFLQLVRDASRQGKMLTQGELLDACGYKRAASLGDILRPVSEMLERAKMSSQLKTEVSETTGRSWAWMPLYKEAVASAVEPVAAAIPEEPVEESRPAVRVRKRQGE